MENMFQEVVCAKVKRAHMERECATARQTNMSRQVCQEIHEAISLSKKYSQELKEWEEILKCTKR